MRSMSVPLLCTSPSLPISFLSTLTLSPFLPPRSPPSAFGRFRTIPSDTVSLWISDLRSEALIKLLRFPPPPSHSPRQFGLKVAWSVGNPRMSPPSRAA
jgi:hypothetical protein